MRPSPSERNPDVAIERLLHGVHGGILLFVGHCRLLQLMERLMVMVGMSMSGTPELIDWTDRELIGYPA